MESHLPFKNGKIIGNYLNKYTVFAVIELEKKENKVYY